MAPPSHASSSTRHRLRLLGGVQFDPPSADALLARPKRLALLAWLATTVDRGPSQRDEILALFWPEVPEEQARTALRQALRVLRRSLGDDAIVNHGLAVSLDPTVVACDVIDLDRALRVGDDAEALRLYRGHFLHGLVVPGAMRVMTWLAEAREQRRLEVIEAAHRLAAQAEAAGEAEHALRLARRAAELMPLTERSVSRLATLMARAEHARDTALADPFARLLDDVLHADVAPTSPGDAAPEARLRVAALPLLNLSGQPLDDAIADGVATEIAHAVGAERADVERIGPASARQLTVAAIDNAMIADQLDAEAVVSGTLAHHDDRLHLVVQLRDRAGQLLWSDRMAVRPTELDDVTQRVGRAVAAALPGAHAVTHPVRQARRAGRHPDAVIAVLRGNHHFWRLTPGDIQQALAHFTEATRLDPESATAWTGVGQALLFLPPYLGTPAAEAYPQAIDALDRAIRLDPTYATAYSTRAAVAVVWGWDFAMAERLVDTAHRLDPSDHESWITELLFLRAPRGDHAGTRRAAARLVALEPAAPVALAYAGLALAPFDRAQAEAQARRALALDPMQPIAHWTLAQVASWHGAHVEALEHADLLVELTGGNAGFRAFRALLRARALESAAALAELGELAHAPALPETARYYVALTQAALGQVDGALDALDAEAAARNGMIIHLRTDRSVAPLDGAARFEALRARVGI
ncbi:MAG: hypothetical protein MUE41_10310 [Gemmatimonadaceae bacterium]|jgi:DNA-binding SARP family transcriptional activator|nr:hypothetical protein [Gemmatimonadaceae bacterium]